MGKGKFMRFSVFAILVAGAVLAAAPARAQTYDPDYPVCLHVFGSLMGEAHGLYLCIAGSM